MTRDVRAVAVVLLIACGSARAQSLDTAAIAERYGALRSYCDEVALFEHRLEAVWRRCFTADGRYRVHERIDNHWRNERIRWGDDRHAYFWGGHDSHGWRGKVTDHYREEPRRRPDHGGEPDGLLAGVLNLFVPGAVDAPRAREVLMHYEADAACDAQELLCYRWTWTNRHSGTVVTQRIWLRAADGLVARAELHWNDTLIRSAALRSVQTDVALGEPDLEHVAPLLDRYGIGQRPAVFVAALGLLSVVAGFLPCVLLDLRRARAGAALPRRSPWRPYLKLAAACAVAFGLLTLGSLGGGGHPPAIVFAVIIDIYAGLALLCVGAALAGAQLARAVARRSLSSAPSAPPA